MTKASNEATCGRCGLPQEEPLTDRDQENRAGCPGCRHLREEELTLLEEHTSMTIYLDYEFTGIFQDYDDLTEHQRLISRWEALGLLPLLPSRQAGDVTEQTPTNSAIPAGGR